MKNVWEGKNVYKWQKHRGNRLRKAYLCNASICNASFDDAKYKDRILKILEDKLAEDCRFDMDVTSESVLKDDAQIYGVIKVKEKGVLAGLEEVLTFYSRHYIKSKPLKKDGDSLEEGEVIAELYGKEKDFLKVERTGLNVLQRMSGVATQTKNLADLAEPYGVKVVGTRKTLLSCLDKKAIHTGGGLPHRFGLYDAILIKDNHLAAIREEGVEDAISTAIERAYKAYPSFKVAEKTENEYDPKFHSLVNFIEIEVSNLEDAVKAAEKFKDVLLSDKASYYIEEMDPFPCIIMFDNMKPSEIRQTIKEFKKKGLYDYVLLEASGGITERNFKQYAKTKVDVISIGYITHSVKALDISQKIVRREK